MTTIPKGSTVVLVGTRKGLYVFHSRDRKRWRPAGRYFEGLPVHHAIYVPDERTGYAAVNSTHWGATVQRSRTLTKWVRAKAGPAYPKKTGWSVAKVWNVRASPAESGVLYAGVEPAGLFRSEDDGDSWELVDALTRHPTRPKWSPGNGGLCLHTILPDPKDARRMIVGISAVGVFATEDGGDTWRTMNRGMTAEWFPKEKPEIGYCPHKLARDGEDPSVVYQQHHGGVFRWDDRADRWVDISRGLPSRFGFALAAGADGGSAYVVPLKGDFDRTTLGEMAVYRTRSAGRSWQRLTVGLPRPAHLTVLREGLGADGLDPLGVYVATEQGQVFFTRDGGDRWDLVAENLPPAMSVTASPFP
jgi:photosystem II stability/assembly factor-like uncharacterized protein